eukprot:5270259-Pyramimonas_sp.AAC.1
MPPAVLPRVTVCPRRIWLRRPLTSLALIMASKGHAAVPQTCLCASASLCVTGRRSTTRACPAHTDRTQ